MPDLQPWQWMLGAFCALVIGIAKTALPGAGTLTAPLMVVLVGDARFAPAWTAPILVFADLFAVTYWRGSADARTLFGLMPWVAIGVVGGGLALGLSEPAVRRIVGGIIVAMLAVNVLRRVRGIQAAGHAPFYGVAAGFATTVANSAGPVMSIYLLSQRLPKERFVATGAWFFFAVNLLKLPIYSAHHLFSRASLLFDVAMIPAVVCGAGGGLWLVRRVPQRAFEVLILVLTALSSLVLFR